MQTTTKSLRSPQLLQTDVSRTHRYMHSLHRLLTGPRFERSCKHTHWHKGARHARLPLHEHSRYRTPYKAHQHHCVLFPAHGVYTLGPLGLYADVGLSTTLCADDCREPDVQHAGHAPDAVGPADAALALASASAATCPPGDSGAPPLTPATATGRAGNDARGRIMAFQTSSRVSATGAGDGTGVGMRLRRRPPGARRCAWWCCCAWCASASLECAPLVLLATLSSCAMCAAACACALLLAM